jgi:hypothetical protein
MHTVSTPAVPCGPPAAPQPRRGALIAIVATAAAITSGGSAATSASAQIISLPPTPVTQTAPQLLELTGGVSPQKLRMIEEEGYLCFMAFHRVPPGISWVCVPPLQ